MISDRFPTAKKVWVLSEKIAQNTTRTASGPTAGVVRARPRETVPRFKDPTAFGGMAIPNRDVSALDRISLEFSRALWLVEFPGYPQQFSTPNLVSLEGRSEKGLSVISSAPVSMNPLGFFPVLAKSIT